MGESESLRALLDLLGAGISSIRVNPRATNPFGHLLLSRPYFVGLVDNDGKPVLLWESGHETPVQEAGWLLGSFVLLAEADEERLLAFARQNGPLGSHPEPSQFGEGFLHIVESVADWRAFAGSMAALLNTAGEVEGLGRAGPVDWVWAIQAPQVAARLHSPAAFQRSPASEEEADVYTAALKISVYWLEDDRPTQWALLREITTRLLDASGVRADSGIDNWLEAASYWTVPAAARRFAEGEG
ncbi:MAG: hypothetical protein ACRERD_10300, partial [Candidatus Binatia bacterium]